MKLLIFFIAISIAVNTKAELSYTNVNNTCTRYPIQGGLPQILQKWIIHWRSLQGGKCGTLLMSKNTDGKTYSAEFFTYPINDTNYEHPEEVIVKSVPDPNGSGLFIAEFVTHNLPDVVTAIVVLNEYGFATIGCDVKDGNDPPIYSSIYGQPNAPESEIDKIKAYVNSLTDIKLEKIYDDANCPSL
ncbi:hypothetical protein CHUAL_000198 [Chamberlinius hualienensis]